MVDNIVGVRMKKFSTKVQVLSAIGAVLGGAVLLVAQNPATMFPVVRGTKFMLGAGNSLEVAAGVQILEKGGNAVDAGVASVLAASITEMDHFGIGGEMPILIKMKDKPVVGIVPLLNKCHILNHASVTGVDGWSLSPSKRSR